MKIGDKRILKRLVGLETENFNKGEILTYQGIGDYESHKFINSKGEKCEIYPNYLNYYLEKEKTNKSIEEQYQDYKNTPIDELSKKYPDVYTQNVENNVISTRPSLFIGYLSFEEFKSLYNL